MKGGKYLLGGFLCKSSLYSIITVSNNFQLGIDYYNDSLRIINLFYLTKVKWIVFFFFRMRRQYDVSLDGIFNFQLDSYYQQYLICSYFFNKLLD